jgi:hypothetical protein
MSAIRTRQFYTRFRSYPSNNGQCLGNSEQRSENRPTRSGTRALSTLPSAKFIMLFESLKLMLNVADEASLPDFWFRLAAAPKKQEFSTIRDFWITIPEVHTHSSPLPRFPPLSS